MGKSFRYLTVAVVRPDICFTYDKQEKVKAASYQIFKIKTRVFHILFFSHRMLMLLSYKCDDHYSTKGLEEIL